MRFSVRSVVVATGSALALAGVLAACSSSSSSSTGSATTAGSSAPRPSAVTSQAAPANPLTIVREAGATVQPGEVYGSSTVQGWLGDGSFSKSGQPDDTYERVTVYTIPPGETGAQAFASTGFSSSDSQIVVTGPTFYMYVYPLQNDEGDSVFSVSPATIAARVHGTVLQPTS